MARFNYKSRISWLLIALAAATAASAVTACGTIRSYWGVESDYEWGDYDHCHHKPHKHKKHKKNKKKHHRHHHDD